jgi:acetyl-CoA carboxylase biotin carboxyl carrier protein
VTDDRRDPPADRRPPRRDPQTRARDHEQIDRLADELLPELIDRLAASGLGELEVREDDWRIRLRLPDAAAAATPDARRSGRAPATPQAPRTGLALTAPLTPVTADSRTNGSAPAAAPAGPHRVIALSPAVGVFQPRPELRAGTRVRQGDRLGVVDLLGVPQDVVAPEDGIVVDTLAENGEGVEYGQDLVVIEPARPRPAGEPLVTES